MILIGLGANLPSKYGDPSQTLRAAVDALYARGVRVVRESSVWVTAPVPMSDQPWYRNMVVAVETALGARALLMLLKAIEADFGRVEATRNAARVLDMDVIAYGDEVLEGGDISIPHARMHERGFVLYPLREVAPDWIHPVSGKSVGDLMAELPDFSSEHDCVREVV
jgi:2-amino-4-hydroxy-6-hydroxymethyldihydropteridine diphosphokinase